MLSADRPPALPAVPTAEQAGLPGYRFNGGPCLWAPGATPAAVIARLNEAVVAAARQPALREKLHALAGEATAYDIATTTQFVREFAAGSERLRAAVFGSGR